MNGETGKKPPESDALSPEERAALHALSYDEAIDALEREDPAAVALATEYILFYSEKVGELLREGRDYLDLLTPSGDTPALQCIAMEMVLETAEEELDSEE